MRISSHHDHANGTTFVVFYGTTYVVPFAALADPPPADDNAPHPEEIAVDVDIISPITVRGGIFGAQRDVPAVSAWKTSWGRAMVAESLMIRASCARAGADHRPAGIHPGPRGGRASAG